MIRGKRTKDAGIMNSHETTRGLDATRAKYRGQIIPKPALAIMDAETARLAASNLASGALKTGDSAPDFILPDAHGEALRLYSLARTQRDQQLAFVSLYKSLDGGWNDEQPKSKIPTP
jgi:hypothetical protein